MEYFISQLTSDDSGEREVAIELCKELVSEPDEEFLQEVAAQIGLAGTDATLDIFELLDHYEYLNVPKTEMDLLQNTNQSVRLAAFRYFKENPSWWSVTILLDALADENSEIRQLAAESLRCVALCETTSFEVAEYLRHDNRLIRDTARSMLLENGQDDLIRMME